MNIDKMLSAAKI